MLCGLPEALSLIVTEPVIGPVCCGANATRTLQVLPTASVVPQSVFLPVLMTKLLLLGVMLLMERAAPPVFDITTVLGLLVVPTAILPQVSEVGVKPTTAPLDVTVS